MQARILRNIPQEDKPWVLRYAKGDVVGIASVLENQLWAITDDGDLLLNVDYEILPENESNE